MGNPNGLTKAEATLNQAGATQGKPNGLTKAQATQGKPDGLTKAQATHGKPNGLTKAEATHGKPKWAQHGRGDILETQMGSTREGRHMGNSMG